MKAYFYWPYKVLRWARISHSTFGHFAHSTNYAANSAVCISFPWCLPFNSLLTHFLIACLPRPTTITRVFVHILLLRPVIVLYPNSNDNSKPFSQICFKQATLLLNSVPFTKSSESSFKSRWCPVRPSKVKSFVVVGAGPSLNKHGSLLLVLRSQNKHLVKRAA